MSFVKQLLFITILFTAYGLSCCKSVEEELRKEERKHPIKWDASSFNGRLCCQKDLDVGVMFSVDLCLKDYVWKYAPKHPIDVCRAKLFGVDSEPPTNAERRARCGKKHNDWVKCLAQAEKANRKGIKPQYMNNLAAVKAAPQKREKCMLRALVTAEC